MIGEYLNIVLMCAMLTILFFGGWHAPIPIPVEGMPDWLVSLGGFLVFCVKMSFFFFLFAMVKAIVPRYRYDQLMRLGWKIFLPTSLVAVVARVCVCRFRPRRRQEARSDHVDRPGHPGRAADGLLSAPSCSPCSSSSPARRR